MASVYSTRILYQQGLVGSETVVPPPGNLWIVRDIWLYWNLSSAPVTKVHVSGDVGQTFEYAQFDVATPNQLAFWQGRVVIENSLTVSVSGDPVDVTVSGYILSLP